MIAWVIWSNHLVNVTVSAAVFFIDLSLFEKCLGRPYNKDLQLSSLELLNVCTKISDASSIKYFLILAMFFKWWWQEPQIFSTSSVKLMINNNPPNSGQKDFFWIFSSPTWMNSKEGLERNWEVITKDEFSFLLIKFKSVIHHPAFNNDLQILIRGWLRVSVLRFVGRNFPGTRAQWLKSSTHKPGLHDNFLGTVPV